MYVTISLIYTTLALVGLGSAHRYGADPMACDTMKPGHGSNVRQTRATPYIIDTNMAGYVPCENAQQRDCGVVVRIRSRIGAINGGQFKGFLLQARTKTADGQLQYVGEYRYTNGQAVTARNNANQMMNNQARMAGQFGAGGGNPFGRKKRQVGPPGFPGGGPGGPGNFPGGVPGGQGFPGNQFTQGMNGVGNNLNNIINNVQVQRMQCVRGSAVTHTESGIKRGITLIWVPPVGFQGGIQFVATVVQDFNTFWMGHRSRELRPRRALRNRPGGGLANTARWFVNSGSKASSSLVLVLTSMITVVCYLFK
ncbi:uncharacterized protein LOC128226733 [Mya arenaria]|uniref:uncharacterized protein LOC128226733 n=1 Tax=Mya arenaria TaxID=6604 RepID=UPI0022E1A7FF|nr:uncharacterized protein LOC128226733 [Mya arenaria]